MFVEKRNKNGIWEAVKGPNPEIARELMYARWKAENGDLEKAAKHEAIARRIASGEQYELTKEDDDLPEVEYGWLYDNRNYALFAILADVRNGYGFAGIKTGEGYKSIDLPRGIPFDSCNTVQDYFGQGWMHSESHVYLNELVNYNWNQTTTRYGVVSEKEYKNWVVNKGRPERFCGSVGGSNIKNISLEEMDLLVGGYVEREKDKQYYTQVSWEESYKESAGDFSEDCIPKLVALSDSEDFSDIRIVFGFDS